ncbi:hypothetical protein ACTFIY_010698 [Dictyostelium cf. discoideum]
MKIILLILIIISVYNITPNFSKSIISNNNKISLTSSSSSSSSSSLNKKYIVQKGYNFVDDECSEEIVNTIYSIDGACYYGNVYTCRDDGKIIYDMYEGYNCNGSIVFSMTIENDVCDSNSSQSYPTVYSCVDSIEIPTSGFLVYTSQDDDCGSKEDLVNLEITPLNICINDDQIYSFIQTCNSTNYSITKYFGTSCKGGPIGHAQGEISCRPNNPNQYSSQYVCL